MDVDGVDKAADGILLTRDAGADRGLALAAVKAPGEVSRCHESVIGIGRCAA